jgi:hypothetical protein
MPALGPQRLLEVWEQGTGRHPIDRALLLFAAAEPDLPAHALADLPLGRRNAALMALHLAQFGNPLPVWCDCPACGERMELSVDATQLPEQPGEQPIEVEIDGRRFTSPNSRQLATLIDAVDADRATHRLLASCAVEPDGLPTDAVEAQALLEAVDAALERADPWLDLCLSSSCPHCAAPVEPSLDIALLLWEEIDAVARHLLDQVDRLARAYGWREQDILGMSEQRRAAYLQRVQT